MTVKTSGPGRLALVTGANSGIGFEIAKQLLAAGLDVLVGARDAIFYADRYAQALAGVARPVTVQVLPGVTHMGLVSQPQAITAIVRAVTG